MPKKICKDCKKEFVQVGYSRYPRKYCDKCSKARKKAYEKIYLVSASDCEDDED